MPITPCAVSTPCTPDRPADDEAVLSSLCQFDFYANLVVIGERGRITSGNYYPNFARYYSRRTEPAFVTMVTDKVVRQTLFDGDDTLLADAIAELDQGRTRKVSGLAVGTG